MPKFFGKKRQKQMTEQSGNKLNRPSSPAGRYILYAIGEIILVVIGILIALSINNWNQNNSERKIENGYVVSLIEDAKTDLSNFKQAIDFNRERSTNLDSLAQMCYNYDVTKGKDPILMIRYMTSLKHPDFVTQTDRTLSQLKNSGGMRLIKDKNKIDAIIKYSASFEKLYNQQDWYEGALNELVNAGIPIFNMSYLPTKPNQKFDQEAFFKTARLVENDNKVLIELGNRVSVYNAITNFYLMLLENGQKECLALIATLEKEK